MLNHYIKIAFRVIRKNKAFSFLNIAGLSVGLAVFALIMLWVKHEMSYDAFHADKERIAAVMTNLTLSNKEVNTFPAVPSMLAKTLKTDLPGIEYASRVSWGDNRLLSVNNKNFTEFGYFADADFLKIFSFPLVKGNADNVLKEPHTILISEKLAKKYFGDEDPIGKQITIEKNYSCKVEGVLKDIDQPSTIRFDFLMPMKDYIEFTMGGQENWTSNNIRSYVKLKPGNTPESIAPGLKLFAQKYTDQQQLTSLWLWKAEDWYLRMDFKNGELGNGGRIVYVRLFFIIAIFILLLACINFMNLSTARATQRAKEVGVRKVTGAARQSLITQFMSESVVMAFIAGIIAVVLVIIVLPSVNNFLRTEISIRWNEPFTILFFISTILITGLLAGSYPSLILSRFLPVKVLKSFNVHSSGGSSVWIRKTLVVAQFSISVLLIIGTLVVRNQVQYVKDKNLGYNKEHLIWFPNNIPQDKAQAAYNELSKVPGVLSVSKASMTFTMANNRGTQVSWPGKQEGDEVFFNFIAADHDIIKTMGIEMKEGRAFSRAFTTDTAAFIINEEAAKRMNLKDPVGKTIELYSGKGTIVGVCKDFHFESLHNPVGPLIFECRPDWTWLYFVKMDGKNVQQTIKGLETTYASLAPGFTFDYNFQDKEYERLYRSEEKIGTLVNWFAFFAIFISCLGLLGLTLFTIERKTKEIGIRKVLGAPVFSIVSLISKQFLLLVSLAIVISVAPAWYFMNKWLQQYAYRYEMNIGLIIVAGLSVMAITAFTISLLAIKASLINPVKSLRSE
jgi:predicted permease